MHPAADDATLVARSLTGQREAFSGIVQRYQGLVCSVAYSATGSLQQSEDVAQETFVAAWRQLGDLREPERLRPWLCGIARNLANNARRREKHEPARAAEPLDVAHDAPSEVPLPVDQAISKEEEDILWRSIANIPETYREPLVLFYREHHSIERVAASLELSEDVVRQRLARGRRLLADEVLAFVEGTLARVTPRGDFTLAVMGALPSSVGAAQAAAAAKGGAVAKGLSLSVLVAALLSLGTGIFAAWAGRRTSIDVARTPRERAAFLRDWRVIVIGAFGFAAIVNVLVLPIDFWSEHMTAFVGCGVTLSVAYSAWLLVALARMIRAQRRLRAEQREAHPDAFAGPRAPLDAKSKRTLLGVPLWHVRIDPASLDAPPVFAWIAVGDRAVGLLFAAGNFAVGTISVGTASAGLLSVGAVSAGIVSIGGVSLGVISMGTVAFGALAMGAVAFGWKAAAGAIGVAFDFASGRLARGAHANDEAAESFFASIHADALFQSLLIVTVVLVVLVSGGTARLARKRRPPTTE